MSLPPALSLSLPLPAPHRTALWQLHPAKAHQVPLALLEEALRLQGVGKDPLELQVGGGGRGSRKQGEQEGEWPVRVGG